MAVMTGTWEPGDGWSLRRDPSDSVELREVRRQQESMLPWRDQWSDDDKRHYHELTDLEGRLLADERTGRRLYATPPRLAMGRHRGGAGMGCAARADHDLPVGCFAGNRGIECSRVTKPSRQRDERPVA